jgi:hypothetical protein
VAARGSISGEDAQWMADVCVACRRIIFGDAGLDGVSLT